LTIEEAGGREAIEKSENFENNTPKYQQTKDWLNGKGKLYVYDISKPEIVDNSEIVKIQEDMKQDANESISDCNGKTPALPDGKNLSGKANKYKKK
jgi:hypothetical protein